MNLALSHLSVSHPAAKLGAPAVLKDLSLQLTAAEQVAIIGPSGAGKTTLLHAMACALKPSGGELLLNNQNPWALPARALRHLRGQLFLAPQTPPLPQRQRVITSVLAGKLAHQSLLASLRSLFYPNDIAGAEAALGHFDLADKLWDRVDRLSGGERQRVGLARAMVSQSTLWLVDEPLSALDPTRAQRSISALVRLAKQSNTTLVASLHQVQAALDHFPRIIGLRDGVIQFDCAAALVTKAMLDALYAQHEDDLIEPLVPQDENEPERKTLPAVMHCR